MTEALCALGAKDRINGRCFSGMWAGESNWKEVSGMAGRVIGLSSTNTTLPELTDVPAPGGPCFWDVWEEIPGGQVCDLTDP